MKRKSKNPFLRGQVWHIRYSHQGEQIRESSHSTVWAEADRLLKLRRGEIVTGRFGGIAAEKITLGELLAAVERLH